MKRKYRRAPDKSTSTEGKRRHTDKPIDPKIYPALDNDLARDNLENDIPAADLSDL